MTTRLLTVALALALAWVAALVGLIWMMRLGGMEARHLPPSLIHLDYLMQACVILSVASAAIGIVSLVTGTRRRAVFGVAGAFGWGVVGALLGVASARNGLVNSNSPIPFSLYAPAYVDVFMVLLVGLTGALLGVVLLGRRAPR